MKLPKDLNDLLREDPPPAREIPVLTDEFLAISRLKWTSVAIIGHALGGSVDPTRARVLGAPKLTVVGCDADDGKPYLVLISTEPNKLKKAFILLGIFICAFFKMMETK